MGSISSPIRGVVEDEHEKPCVTLDQLIRRRAATHADRVLISYPSHETDFLDYTGADLESITRRVAAHLAGTLDQVVPGLVEPKGNTPASSLVVALVGISSLEYYITFLALQRLGVTTLFISPRLADPGYVHLLTKTGCQIAIACGPSFHTLDRLRKNGSLGGELALIPMIDSALITRGSKTGDEPVFRSRNQDGTQPQGFIIHSGGTTGLPKPVPLSAAAWLLQAADIVRRIPRADTLSTLPLFHSFGLATLLRGLVNGTRLSLLNAARPVTAAIIQEALDGTASQALVTVPYTLKFLVESSGGVERLGMLRQVINAGSAVPDDLGDKLVAAGANIFHLYGQTESGALMEPPQDRLLWSWVTPLPHAAPYLKFEPEGSDVQSLYHLVVLPGLKQKVLSDRPDGSYGTKDLFQRHPTRPNLWKFAARKDDIIVMLNGEKADPIPLEEAVTANPHVRVAVAFGAGRDALGLLAIRSSGAASLSCEEFLESVMPDLELGNSRVPAYARVSREMVVVKNADTPFPATDKSTVIRPAFLKAFECDIEQAYNSMQKLKTGAANGETMSYAQILDLVSRAVEDELKAKTGGSLEDNVHNGQELMNPLRSNADFFDIGLDSLQASNIRSRLLREVNLHGRALATNVVFDYPSVELLSGYLLAIHLEQAEEQNGENVEFVAQSMVKKYCAFAISQPGTLNTAPGEEHVLLTGATGQVGAHILSVLLRRDTVQRVFCLVRAPDEQTGLARLRAALRDAQLLDALSDRELDKAVACPGDLANQDGHFGLAGSTRESICSTVTSIIHNAWAVNFNLALQSFEAQSIRPTYHLVNLALGSRLRQKPTFTFVSSIATVLQAERTEGKILERLYGWESVGSVGYGQSKWVAEEILAAAAAQTGLDVRVARLGQVVGDTKHGNWKATEAYPTVVQSALTIGALPVIEPAGGPSAEVHDAHYWLPVDTTGAAIVDVALHRDMVAPVAHHDETSSLLSVFNITNPKPVRWNADVIPAVRGAFTKYNEGFEAVPQREWLRRLEESEVDVSKNPPRKLMQFFLERYGSVGEPGEPALDMKNTYAVSPTLQDEESSEGSGLSEDLIKKFVDYWVKECWVSRPDTYLK